MKLIASIPIMIAALALASNNSASWQVEEEARYQALQESGRKLDVLLDNASESAGQWIGKMDQHISDAMDYKGPNSDSLLSLIANTYEDLYTSPDRWERMEKVYSLSPSICAQAMKDAASCELALQLKSTIISRRSRLQDMAMVHAMYLGKIE